MPDEHALLSASGSHRWLECTPSAKLEANYKDEGSPYAEEGTRAHAMAEQRLNAFLAGKTKRKPKDADAEMWETTGTYVDVCIERINEARKTSPDAEIHVEQRLDFSRWVPQGFGTGDMVIVSDEFVEIVDLKYGKGVPVSAAGNTQMMLYALGAYEAYGLIYNFEKVRMTIVQPRLDSISTEEIPLDELLKWGVKEVIPKAALAIKGEGEKVSGDHCRFCKCRAVCRTLADAMLKDVKTDFAASDLTEIELADLVLRAGEIKKWLTCVEEYALSEALKGRSWEGLKLVEGRSSRKIVDTEKACELLRAAKYGDDVIFKPQELNTLTELEKRVGKKELAEILAEVIQKPPGKPTLAPESDKRPAIDVKNDFDDNLLKGE